MFFLYFRKKTSVPVPSDPSGKNRLENLAVSLKFPSGAEVDFVLARIVYSDHRVFTSFKKMSFRPIIHMGAGSSAFSSLRSVFLRTAFLIEKTQYFGTVASLLLLFSLTRFHDLYAIYIGSRDLHALRSFLNFDDFAFVLMSTIRFELGNLRF